MSVAEQLNTLREKFAAAGQEQCFEFYDNKKLTDEKEMEQLLASLNELDLEETAVNYESVQHPAEEKEEKLTPFSNNTHLADCTAEEQAEWNTTGLKLIANSQLSVFLLAGGQGTRLGSSKPKGCYDIKMPSGKSLFEFQSQRIIKAIKLAAEQEGKDAKDISVPFYVMTSLATDAGTREFFEKNNFFGLPKADVCFFQQALLPCLTKEGKILMETPTKPARSPNGNGGVWKALVDSGSLDDMKKRGIKYCHLFGVDNALVKVADPLLLGFAECKKITLVNKVVSKINPSESVGVFGLRNGLPGVIEYCELSDEMANARDESGRLSYSAGNIVQHMIAIDMLDVLCGHKLPFHVAHKKIAAVTPEGTTVKPSSNNGIKLEMFIFDVFQYAPDAVCFYVSREEEFSPVKNAPGNPVDSPDSARKLMSEYHTKLAKAAGATIVVPEGFEGEPLFEISPLVSYGGEGLESLCKGKTFTVPYHLSSSL